MTNSEMESGTSSKARTTQPGKASAGEASSSIPLSNNAAGGEKTRLVGQP